MAGAGASMKPGLIRKTCEAWGLGPSLERSLTTEFLF